MTTQPTKRPWHITKIGNIRSSNDIGIANMDYFEKSVEEYKANSELIIKAVNCHDELVEALKELNRSSGKGCWCEMAIGNPMVKDHSKGCLMAKQALKRAEEAGK